MKSLLKTGLLATTITVNLFSAGYILPNGTILYDNSQDQTIYKVEKLSPGQPQVGMPNQIQTEISQPIQTSSVVIEDRTVVYDRPVYIRERIFNRNPVYDIVDVAGAVLVYGLIYDGMRHSFYHHELHRGQQYYRYNRR